MIRLLPLLAVVIDVAVWLYKRKKQGGKADAGESCFF